MYYIIQCRFDEFLPKLCRENAFFWDPCRNITTRSQCMTGFLCGAIFRVRSEILIFGEIYTSGCVSYIYTVTAILSECCETKTWAE